MAFASTVLRDGEWVTERVNFQDALKATADTKLPTAEDHIEVPNCGILSRTILESPTPNWILPVRLRSKDFDDVCFIGDHYVQICEFRLNGQLYEVIRKIDFDYRIRNAVSIGPPPTDDPKPDANPDADPDANLDQEDAIKTEDHDVLMRDDQQTSESTGRQPLPPQVLVLMLETGDVVFLFVRGDANGSFEFVTSKYDNPTDLQFLGHHLTVDPSSRYMAASSSEGAFVVYELESLENLNTRYLQDESFEPVINTRTRAVQGNVHRLHFLHPRPVDDYHIILQILICRRELPHGPRMRMALYDWELGENLVEVFAAENPGTVIEPKNGLPDLIVPLHFNAAFIAVTTTGTWLVKDALMGQPDWNYLATKDPNESQLGIISQGFLWTAWARPFRRKGYFRKNDIVYLAREDGTVNYVEIDESSLTTIVHHVGSVETSVSNTTAFTTVYNRYSDVLITIGDTGIGGIWKLNARSLLQRMGSIPNWSLVWDMTTTDESSSWISEESSNSLTSRRKASSKAPRKPDRIFCISGQKGLISTLTELRWGVQASIGLEFDYGQTVRQCWMFPVDGGLGGHYALLSLPGSSEVFHIAGNLENADALSPETSPFDFQSRTICATQNEHGIIVQISETLMTLVAPSQSSRHHHSDVLLLEEAVVGQASCQNNVAVLSTYKDQKVQLHVLQIDQMSVTKIGSWDVQGEVTCLSLFTIAEQTLVAVGSVVDQSPCVSIHSLDGSMVTHKSVDGHDADQYGSMEPFTSVSIVTEKVDGIVLVLGTRSGHLVTCRVSQPESVLTLSVERLGMGPTRVFSATETFGAGPAVFACCDDRLSILTGFSQKHTKFKTKSTVWPVDLEDASLPAPPIHSIFCLEQSLYGYDGHMSLMMLAGSRVLLADIRPQFDPVPRTIKLEGLPSRILYSKTWDCLVVAHLKNDRSTLSFIDPSSGETISRPCARSELQPVDYISGLGILKGRVWSLCEWNYVKDGKTFPFILVGTESDLLIVSVKREDVDTENGRSRQLQYFTRYRMKGFKSPVYSVVGSAENLLICFGDILQWQVLEAAEKRLRYVKQFQLNSEAISLKVADGKAYVLTARHSLQVIDLHVESETTDMSLIHSDQVTRRLYGLAELGDSLEPHGKWPIHLGSSQRGDMFGLWVPWNKRNMELQVVFEGFLTRAVRKFGRGRTRPLWLEANQEQRYNSLSSTVDGAQVFGVGLNGSLQHFSLLGIELWRFLRLIQNLAELSAEVCPFKRSVRPLNVPDGDMDVDAEFEPRAVAHMMHVDGDMLQRCVDLKALEMLTRVPDAMDIFCGYLDGIDNGAHTEGFRCDEDGGRKRYIQLGYDILDYVFEPVW